MKNSEKKSVAKRNLMSLIRYTGVVIGMFVFIIACDPPADETTTDENVDSLKTLEIQKVDTTVVKDTAKQVDISVKK